jgi:acetyl esterase/lipase
MSSSQTITRNIDFGSDYLSRLDIYLPHDKVGDRAVRPVIVYLYGGRWTYGSKNDYRFAAEAFTSLGYIVVIPDYIKYPAAKFPAWQKDVARAIAWTHNNIALYGGDPHELFVLGHSAGAQIGALLAADDEYLHNEGGSRNWIKAFAGLAGPYDFTPDEADLKDMFGPPARYAYMKPGNYIDGAQPPMLLLWGRNDSTVRESNISRLAAILQKTQSRYLVKYYDDTDHYDIAAALSIPARDRAPVVKDVNDFFRSYIGR